MGNTENRPSIEKRKKLSDCIDSFFLLEGKTVVGTRRKPSWFLPVQREPRRMIGVEKKAFLLIPGMTTKFKKLSLKKFVRGIVQRKQRGTVTTPNPQVCRFSFGKNM